MRTIIVATDFSDQAEIAAACGMIAARQLGAKLLYVHASERYDARPTAFEISQGHLETFREELQRELARRRQLLEGMVADAQRQGVQASEALLEGAPADAICRAATEVEAELIVMGSHGRTGLKRVLLGSVAERVVRLAPCSVLVGRKPVIDEHGFRRILVPTDFESGALAALEQASSMAAGDAAIDLLHCWFVDGIVDGTLEPGASEMVYRSMADALVEDAERRGAELMERAGGSDRKVNLYLHEGKPAGGVQTFLEKHERGYDLVAVGTHGRRGLERLVMGSVAEATVRYSPCSVLVARASR